MIPTLALNHTVLSPRSVMSRFLLTPSAVILFSLFAFCRPASLCAGDDVKKVPVPGKNALAKSAALIKDIFGDDIAKAKTGDLKSKLATVLLQQGDESKLDAADRYVLYEKARELAALAGDATLALAAADKLSRHFDINAVETKTATLGSVIAHVDSPDAGKALVDL